MVEGAGAAGLAALLANPQLFAGRKVGLVLSGGNIDTRLLASVLMRGLVREAGSAPARYDHRRARPARPRRQHDRRAGGNIVEVQHQRLFAAWSPRPPSSTSRSRPATAHHMRELLAALEADGFEVRVLEGVEG